MSIEDDSFNLVSNKSRPEPNREAVAVAICGRQLVLMYYPKQCSRKDIL